MGKLACLAMGIVWLTLALHVVDRILSMAVLRYLFGYAVGVRVVVVVEMHASVSKLTTDERFARLFPLLEEYERRHGIVTPLLPDTSEGGNNAVTEPLVSIERAHEIRQFHIALAELQHAYGLKLQGMDEGEPLAIIDARREMPQGYIWSGLILSDGTLEVTEYVKDE